MADLLDRERRIRELMDFWDVDREYAAHLLALIEGTSSGDNMRVVYSA